jgi:hypothetical protein
LFAALVNGAPVWFPHYSIVRTVIEGVDGVAHNAVSLSVSLRTDHVGAACGAVVAL